jgi:rhodanese-related sulfurtransferase
MFSRRPTPEISVDELDGLLKSGSVHLLDVREPWEFTRRRVPGATSIPLGRLTASVGTLPKDKPYAVICESGHRSLAAAEFLLGQGFEGAMSVAGGTAAWARGNRPTEMG